MSANCFWYKLCPICDEGQLYIVEDLSRHRLYLHCDECESGFEDPADLQNLAKRFLTLDFDYSCRFADWETIRANNWQQFATHSLDVEQAPKIC